MRANDEEALSTVDEEAARGGRVAPRPASPARQDATLTEEQLDQVSAGGGNASGSSNPVEDVR